MTAPGPVPGLPWLRVGIDARDERTGATGMVTRIGSGRERGPVSHVWLQVGGDEPELVPLEHLRRVEDREKTGQ
ncbi:hypothetical protein [Streptomyces sp. ISL-94]|uniref:hypothetical protein n=1 Tax=Streptomyces sp. ISL-94 TaxID=2819190 RepID=UPI001BE955B7|nr:hypothetical protein [Streptomyces sp. ISL-94]MBT2478364.1 hypothetical protein [Streptomyces sp. ISL-94]